MIYSSLQAQMMSIPYIFTLPVVVVVVLLLVVLLLLLLISAIKETEGDNACVSLLPV